MYRNSELIAFGNEVLVLCCCQPLLSVPLKIKAIYHSPPPWTLD